MDRLQLIGFVLKTENTKFFNSAYIKLRCKGKKARNRRNPLHLMQILQIVARIPS